MHGRRAAVTVLGAAVATVGCGWVSGQVVVQQVEAGIAAGQPAYSPVEFNGSASVSGGTAYPGITFFAQGPTTGGTFSVHAQVVANSFFGPSTLGATVINQVYVHAAVTYGSNGFANATPFYTNTLRMAFNTTNTPFGSVTVPTMVAPVPNPIGNNIRVTNHSYVLQFAPTASSNTTYNNDQNLQANLQAIRRADFLIDRDNVVWVGGAVTGQQFVGGDGTTTMAWQTRNGIAVRGDAGQTPFNPALGRPGRQHADVWGPNLASFTAGDVSGGAAALIRQSQIANNTAMGDARVIKSVIMTGANKTIQPSTFNFSGGAWQPTTQNNLDPAGGAGRFDYNASLGILTSPQRTFASSTTATTGGVIAVGASPTANPSGWALGSIASGGASVVLVQFNSALTYLASTLNWNVTSATTNAGANIDTTDAGLIFPDLALELRPVGWNGTQYTLGAAIANATGRRLSSDATGTTNDNVEHIFNTAGTLSPGTYALVVRGDTARSVTAALSYTTATNGITPTWNTNANGALTTAGNWTGNTVPNAVSAPVVFGPVITAPRSLNTLQGVTYGTVTFDSANAYTLTTANSSTLTLANGALGPAEVNLISGSHTIDMPVVTPGTTQFSTASAGQTLTLRSLNNTGTLLLSGPGTVNVTSTVSGNGTINVGRGSTLLLSSPGSTSSSVRVLEQGSLFVDGSSLARGVVAVTGTSIPPSGPRPTRPNVIVLNGLSIANDGAALGSRTYFGFLDLQSNDMVVRSGSPAAQAATLANLRDMVRFWLTASSGLPGLAGLGSTSAFYPAQGAFATLAVYDNSGVGGSTIFSTFNGVSVGPNDVLVKYTYIGDLNLDGVVDAADLSRALQGFNGGGTGWNFGDVNYDGVVDFFDLGRITAALRGQGSPLGDAAAPSMGGPIPEPAGLGLLALALPALRRRR
ncbi:MAG: hypothetical protein ACK4PI_06815 [Tepidisphaerales bacterium]